MQLIFNSKPLLLTEVLRDEEVVAILSYPLTRKTVDLKGTDSGKSGWYKGKKMKDPVEIQILGDDPVFIFRKLLTEYTFFTIKNNYQIHIQSHKNTVFSCEETYTNWAVWPCISFTKNNENYTLINSPLRTRTWTLYAGKDICGRFTPLTHSSPFLSIIYEGDDRVNAAEIIYLYSIILKPGR